MEWTVDAGPKPTYEEKNKSTLLGFFSYRFVHYFIFIQVLNLLGWATATAVALLVLYGLYDPSGSPKLSVGVMAFYNATSRTAWAMAVCWVIVACATGHGGKHCYILFYSGDHI